VPRRVPVHIANAGGGWQRLKPQAALRRDERDAGHSELNSIARSGKKFDERNEAGKKSHLNRLGLTLQNTKEAIMYGRILITAGLAALSSAAPAMAKHQQQRLNYVPPTSGASQQGMIQQAPQTQLVDQTTTGTTCKIIDTPMQKTVEIRQPKLVAALGG